MYSWHELNNGFDLSGYYNKDVERSKLEFHRQTKTCIDTEQVQL